MRGLAVALRPFRRLARTFWTTRRTLASLPDVVEAVLVLPRVAHKLEVVAFQTATLLDLRDELTRVQGNTSVLPRVDDRLDHMHDVLLRVDANTKAVQQLAEIALPLSGVARRVGRFADRFPERSVPVLGGG